MSTKRKSIGLPAQVRPVPPVPNDYGIGGSPSPVVTPQKNPINEIVIPSGQTQTTFNPCPQADAHNPWHPPLTQATKSRSLQSPSFFYARPSHSQRAAPFSLTPQLAHPCTLPTTIPYQRNYPKTAHFPITSLYHYIGTQPFLFSRSGMIHLSF